MSGLSNITRSKDTIFNELLVSNLKEGNKYVLRRNFALGDGWEKDKAQFSYQYLNLLCNFSPDIESYFTLKLRPYLSTVADTELNRLITAITAKESCTERLISNASRIDYILGELCEIKGFDNISKVIYVSDANISPYTGTLEEKITLYISSLGYIKADIESEVWIEYIGTLWS